MGSRDYCNAKANAGDGRAMLRYFSRRREIVRDQDLDGQEREEWRKLEPITGSDRELEEGLQWREKKGREVSYMSVVISPERGDLELRDEDWRRISQVWTQNRNGKEERHVGYIHRDTEHPHMHLAVARSYYSKKEYEENKEQTRQIVREIEREREQERLIDRIFDRERERERGRDLERAQERESGREPERDR